MENTIVIGIGFLTFLVGLTVGRIGREADSISNSVADIQNIEIRPERDFERERNRSLEQELEWVKRNCRLHHQPPFLGCGGCQRIADMLAKAKDTATQLVKDLSA
jgi:hypothetical protein